jgi:hypothetical protein
MKIATLCGVVLAGWLHSPSLLADKPCPDCCKLHGGVQYCDSSSGRYVCNDGDYSVCYCTKHAVMDLQKISGCCLWHGGVFRVNEHGAVICNDATVSEVCTYQNPAESIAVF